MNSISYLAGQSLEENRICPKCLQKTLHRHGYRQRLLKRGSGTEILSAVRYHCVNCSANITVLPPDALPYKHYAAPEIETAVESITPEEQRYEAEDSTVRRWRKEVAGWLLVAWGRLLGRRKLLVKSSSLAGFKKYVADKFPEQREPFHSTLEYLFWFSHPLCV